MTVTPLLNKALIEEAAKKSGLVWVRGPQGPARALWHVWHDGAVCLVGDGPREQPLTGLGLVDAATVTVTVRSKDKGGRLVAWTARVGELPPNSVQWTETVQELKGKRLNAPDGDTMTERWARECRVLRLAPTGRLEQKPGDMPESGTAAVPPPTPATTRQPMPDGLPKLLFRARQRRRKQAR